MKISMMRIFFIRLFVFLQERAKYKKLQNEKDEEISILTDEINKLKRDFDAQRDDIEKFKRKQQQQDLSRSTDSISTINEKFDDDGKGEEEIF
jgi:phage shock protein A